MIDIRREKMFPDDVFVMDHLVPNVNYVTGIKEIERILTKKLRKARKNKQYNHYVFYTATDGWENTFRNFIESNDIIPITGNLDFSSKWKWFPHWLAVTDSIDPLPTKNSTPEIRWQYWVRRPREHRIKLLEHLSNKSIKDEEIVFPKKLVEPNGKTWKSTIDLFENRNAYKNIEHRLQVSKEIIPGNNGAYVPSYEIRLNRAIDVVTETMTHDEGGIFFSEKTFKAIRAGQIPIILGQRGSITSLRNFGFKTFDKWIDHSYDDTWDVNLKAKRIAEELSRISNLSDDDFAELWHETYEDRVYNQQYKNYKLDYWKKYLNSFFV